MSTALPASLRADPALGAVLVFSRRFGRGALELAMHAALPLGLSPELVHLLRVNFVPGAPFIAEADLLLSPLCAEVGGGMYEMDADVRELLLDELSRTPGYGAARVRAVARFLRLWAARALEDTADADALGHLRVQQWVGLAYDEPARAAEELARALRAGVEAGSRPEVVRVARLTGVLSAPLAAQVELRRYAGAVERVASARSTTLAAEAGEVTVGRERLPAFGRVLRLWRPSGASPGTEAPAVQPDARQQAVDPDIQQQAPELDIQPQDVQQQPLADALPAVTADELCGHLAGLGRADNDLLCEFARGFLARMPRWLPEKRALEVLAGMTVGAWEFLCRARPDQVNVQVVNPEEEGWSAAITVLRAEVGDRPFLVDTIREYLAGEDLPIHQYVYPVLRVQRDGAGEIVGVGGDEGTLEALTHAEVARVNDPARREAIRDEVRRRLADVVEATSDFDAMVAQAEAVAQTMEEYAARFPERAEEFVEQARFLRWLTEGNYVFLGYREYVIQGEGEHSVIGLAPGSGLGILRDPSSSTYQTPRPVSGMKPVLRDRLMSGPVLSVAKSNRESTVHRRARMDYVGVKTLDEQGRIRGERRFLGLFTSQAYGADATDIPVLRGKLMRVLERSGARPGSHDYKEIVNLLNTTPKEELFSASIEQLEEAVQVAFNALFVDEVRVVVRTDAALAAGTAMVIFPRGPLSAELRTAVGRLLGQHLGGDVLDQHISVEDDGRVRVYFTISLVEGVPNPDARTLEREMAALVARWPEVSGGGAATGAVDGAEEDVTLVMVARRPPNLIRPGDTVTVGVLLYGSRGAAQAGEYVAGWDGGPAATGRHQVLRLRRGEEVEVRLRIPWAPQMLSVEMTWDDAWKAHEFTIDVPVDTPARNHSVHLDVIARGRVHERFATHLLRIVPRSRGPEAADPTEPAPDRTAPGPESRPERTRVFVSYSHADAKWLDLLRKHLRPLEREGVTFWDDTRLQPGTPWREEIRAALAETKVAILLVSADYLASDFIATNELPPLLQAAAEDGATILAVIVSPCRFERTPGLARFQAVNDPRQPLVQMRRANREKVLDQVAWAVEEALSASGRAPAPDDAETVVEPLFLAILAPESARPGETIQVRAVVSAESARAAAAESVQRPGEGAVSVRWGPEIGRVPAGTPLEIRIMRGLVLEPAITRTEWDGKWQIAGTPVTLPADEVAPEFGILVEILSGRGPGRMPIGRMRVSVRIIPHEPDAPAPRLLREQARAAENRGQWAEAVTLYRQFLEANEGEDADIALWNRVGDLHLRLNNTDAAVEAYERAVDLYVDKGLYNNAIALCRKILRLVPERAIMYRRLGQISATAGFMADARQNFLEYAQRMRRAGDLDASFEALEEFADLSPEQADVRRLLADQLLSAGRTEKAVEQLRLLRSAYLQRGDDAAAEAVREQIDTIDPQADEPR